MNRRSFIRGLAVGVLALNLHLPLGTKGFVVRGDTVVEWSESLSFMDGEVVVIRARTTLNGRTLMVIEEVHSARYDSPIGERLPPELDAFAQQIVLRKLEREVSKYT